MDTVTLEIDGKKIEAPAKSTILQAAQANGIDVPNLCHNDKLECYGACRLCMVEIDNNGRKKLVASCAYPVEQGLVVKTNSEEILKMRRMIVELLWPTTPELASRLGVTSSRFAAQETNCHLCGLCVRYCNEVKKRNVVYFKGRGIDRRPAIVPGMENECVYCRECFDLCSGGWIVSQCSEAYSR